MLSTGSEQQGLEHQGQNTISDPDQNLGFTCTFSSGMQEHIANRVSGYFLLKGGHSATETELK